MKSPDITTPRERPVSVLSGLYYRQQTDDFLASVSEATGTEILYTGVTGQDTSVYEFPGDLTYARYLINKAV